MITSGYGRILRVLTAAGVAAGLLRVAPADATERRFTYTYESATLGAGEREIEPWSTFRYGRDHFFRAIDNRIEIEFGLSDRLMASWYLNLGTETEDVADAKTGIVNRQTRFSHGISSEWKYKLLDNVADPLGLALYLEGEATSEELGLETRVILDKRLGNVLAALNVVGEYEWDSASGTTEAEEYLEFDAGAAYFLTPSFSLGLELQDQNELTDEWENSVFSGGPVASFSSETWWATLTVLPQLANLKRTENAPRLELDDHEKLQARLIFGAHF